MTSERTPLVTDTATASAPKPAPNGRNDPYDLGLNRTERFQIMLGCWTAAALVSLDSTITAALVGPIAASFEASHEAVWLGTAFLLANITFTPLYGRLCGILGRRIANGSAILLFTGGTVLCAVAPSMRFLILARFLAGAGGGGINTTSSVIAADLFPLKQRALISSISTAISAIGGATGGPLGGVLSDWFGWRSAFMLQVPLLALSFLSNAKQINYAVPGSNNVKESIRQKLARIDWIGCGSVFVSMGALLVLLAEKNNENKPWSDPLVIVACVIAPIYLALFLVNEALWAKEPILPYRILSRRVPVYTMLVTIFIAMCNFGVMYSLPLFFLAVEGKTAGEAGGHLLPLAVGNIIGSFVAGAVIHRTGKYRIATSFVGVFSVISVVLMSRLTSESSELSKWLDVLPLSIGFAHMRNTSFVALMASVSHADMPLVTGCLWLFRCTGQILGVATTGALLQHILTAQLSTLITGPGSGEIIRTIRENSSVIAGLEPGLREAARKAYAVALRSVFGLCMVAAVGAWVAVCLIPNLSLDPSDRPTDTLSPTKPSPALLSATDEEEALLAGEPVEPDDAVADRRVEEEFIAREESATRGSRGR
ncbi:hypothetical protein JCM8547_005780 [Rhodosporidiobolus lusitaniae]